MTKRSNYNFIFETTSVVTPGEIQVIAEGKTPEGKDKIVFRSRLQESNVVNSNKRIYDHAICESIVKQLTPRADARSLMMEIDHPMFVAGGDPNMMKRRASVVEVNNCGGLLRKIGYNNGQVIGEVETLTGLT